MKKSIIGIMSLGALLLSSSSFAASLTSQDVKMQTAVNRCVSDIQNHNSGTLNVIYNMYGGVYKYCNTTANNVRKAITPQLVRLEKYNDQIEELIAFYFSMSKEDRGSAMGKAALRKIVDLNSPQKLDSRHAESKIMVYRKLNIEIDKLESLLANIENR